MNKMTSAVTHEIEVSVETEYQPELSHPDSGLFMFAYHIKIENHSEYAVQLLRRHWFIYDSNGEYREVEGEGVVGEQPILEQGQYHTYSSACNLVTDMGKMYGSYEFVRLADGKLFTVDIPEFKMVTPFRLN
jgi:ApaG protein